MKNPFEQIPQQKSVQEKSKEETYEEYQARMKKKREGALDILEQLNRAAEGNEDEVKEALAMFFNLPSEKQEELAKKSPEIVQKFRRLKELKEKIEGKV